MTDGGKLLIIGLIMLFLVGGLVPYLLSSFTITGENYDGYLTPIINLINDGIDLPLLPNIDIFGFLGNGKSFIISQLQGYQLIPALIGIPLLIINITLIAYSILRLIRG